MRITKKKITEFVKHKLATDKKWAIRAMLKIYEFQTAHEQNTGSACYLNGVGFSGADAEILTSFVKFYKVKRYLTDKQMKIVFKKISRYHRQIISISDSKKLNGLIAIEIMQTEGATE